MTDALPKKRPWFQLHLSTCVVLMFVAGACIGANLIEYTPGYSVDMDSDDVFDYGKYYGWPSSALRGYLHIEISGPPLSVPSYLEPDWRYEWLWLGVAINSATLLAILIASTLACEKLLRRRERKRAATAKEPAP